MIRKIILLVTVCGMADLALAQGIQIPREFGVNGVIRCAATEHRQHLINQNLAEKEIDFEKWIAKEIEQYKKFRRDETPQILTIPVVVHVVHSGEAVGSGKNISYQRVLSQIETLNQDFRRIEGTQGYNDHPDGADVEIEFCLAQQDTDGNPTDGVNRVYSTKSSWNESSIENELKPQTQWNPEHYFNIWVVKFGGDLNGVAGYAQFPTSPGVSMGQGRGGGAAATDGVVIDWTVFGNKTIASGQYQSPYDLGRTATHEVGHCLGLTHIWGDTSSCTVNGTDSLNDYCLDTPAASRANLYCTSGTDTCPSSPNVDMIENYMDYTPDACMNIFTNDQKVRMRTVMINSPRRKTLPASTACEPPMGGESFDAIRDFALYPNPNNGTFTVQFSPNNNEASIKVHDISGRLILTHTISGYGLKNEDVSLQNVQKGVYLVTVQDGTKRITRKIVVQ